MNHSNLSDAEIASLVSEKVMGWEKVPELGDWGIRLINNIWEMKASADYDPCNSPDACFGPEGVVGKIKELNLAIEITYPYLVNYWRVQITHNELSKFGIVMSAVVDNSLCRAICLAALAAVEE